MGWLGWLEELIYGAKNCEILDLKSQVEQLEKDKIDLTECIRVVVDKFQFQLFEADKQIALLNSQIETLNKWLVEAIQIPDITNLINPDAMKTVDPYALPNLNGYYLTAADPKYHTLPKEVWQSILNLVHKEVVESIKVWRKNISDCDNWSTTTQDVASLAFIYAKLLYQGAIMIAWSNTHAYNVFLDIDNVAWVYEPQNNRVVGKLGETVGTYDTRLLWIPT